jgi:hypothetical protein
MHFLLAVAEHSTRNGSPVLAPSFNGILLSEPLSVVVCPLVAWVIPPYSVAMEINSESRFFETRFVVPLLDELPPDCSRF